MVDGRFATKEELRWARRLGRVLKDMPGTLEIGIQRDSVSFRNRGTMSRHMGQSGMHDMCMCPEMFSQQTPAYCFAESESQ